MKRNEVKVDVFRNGAGFVPGVAKIIGSRPEQEPYINIEDGDGVALVSIDTRVMNVLVKKWVKALGERL